MYNANEGKRSKSKNETIDPKLLAHPELIPAYFAALAQALEFLAVFPFAVEYAVAGFWRAVRSHCPSKLGLTSWAAVLARYEILSGMRRYSEKNPPPPICAHAPRKTAPGECFEPGGVHEVPDPSPTPFEAVAAAEEASIVESFLCRLDPEERLVLEAHELDAKSYAAISRLTGRLESTLRSVNHRALKKLAAIAREVGLLGSVR